MEQFVESRPGGCPPTDGLGLLELPVSLELLGAVAGRVADRDDVDASL